MQKTVQLNLLELENLSPADISPTGSSSGKGVCAPPASPSLPPSEIEALEKEKENYRNAASKIERKIAYLQKKQKVLEEKKRRIEWRGDDSLEKEVSCFVEDMKKANCNYAYIQIQYAEGTDYYGNHHYRIACEHTEEIIDKGINPFTGEENSYGGMWGSGGPDLDETTPLNRDVGVAFLQQLLEYKKGFLKKPYLNPADGWQLTSIKGVDYRIFFDKKVIEIFSKYGDVEKFIRHFNSLDNRPPTEEELNTSREYYQLGKEINQLEKNEDIEKALRCLFDLEDRYSCGKAEMPMGMAGKSLDELYQLHQEKKRKLTQYKTKFEEIRKGIWSE